MERIQAAIEKARALREGRGPEAVGDEEIDIPPPRMPEGHRPRDGKLILGDAVDQRPDPEPERGPAGSQAAAPAPAQSGSARGDGGTGRVYSRRPAPTSEDAARARAEPVQTAQPARHDPAQDTAPESREDPRSEPRQERRRQMPVYETGGDGVARPRGAPRAPRFHMPSEGGDTGLSHSPVWQDLRPFKPDPRQMRRHRIVSYDRGDEAHVAYDMMRTRLLRVMRENNWTTVAITSPTANCGKTTTTLNLAFSLAYQQDTRSVVIDVDLRRPQMGKVLGVSEVQSMARILDGTGQIEENFVRYGDTLAIGTNDRAVRHPSELFQNRAAGQALANLKQRMKPDVVLFDMPPMMSNDDVMAFLPHVDCVLLVAAAEATTIDDVDKCERELGEQTNVLGVILNKCRYVSEKYGYY